MPRGVASPRTLARSPSAPAHCRRILRPAVYPWGALRGVRNVGAQGYFGKLASCLPCLGCFGSWRTWVGLRRRASSWLTKIIQKSRAPFLAQNYGGFGTPFKKISSPVRPLGGDSNFLSCSCKGKCSSYYY